VLASRFCAAILRPMNAQAPSRRATILALATTALLLILNSTHAAFLTPDANWSISYDGIVLPYPLSPVNGGPSGTATFNNGYDQDTSTSLQLVGPNNATYLHQATRLLVTSRPLQGGDMIPASFTFDWTKSTADNRGSAQDQFGYFIIHNNTTTYSTLGDNVSTPNLGSTAVSGLQVGDRFGFFVYSKDNDKGALTFTISNFNGALAAVPEASAFLTLAFSAIVVGGMAWRRRSASKSV
jgi:hypothetical protein